MSSAIFFSFSFKGAVEETIKHRSFHCVRVCMWDESYLMYSATFDPHWVVRTRVVSEFEWRKNRTRKLTAVEAQRKEIAQSIINIRK